jgi:hypothetical protein
MHARPLFRPLCLGLVLLAAAACASCSGGGPALNPVRGQVLDGKGQPLAGVNVTLHPKGEDKNIKAQRPFGRSGADGAFTLSTGDKDGAPAGDYTVTLIWPDTANLPEGKIALAPPESKDRLNGAYANPQTSTLHATVKAGTTQLDPIRLPK